MAKDKKVRADFRKNRSTRTRQTDWTQQFEQSGLEEDKIVPGERISGKGELSRRRTVRVSESAESADPSSLGVVLDVDEATCLRGRVLSVHGLISMVRLDDGRTMQCATRRLLKTLSTDQRHVVAAGDLVVVRPVEQGAGNEGIIERIEPRRGVLSRTSRGRQQVIVANVDQALIIASAAEPRLKPNLIDRLLVSAEQGKIRPLIVINKIDLVDPAEFQPLVGVYAQMGYEVLLASAKTGFGISRLRVRLAGRQSVVAGQSGVGKSSLLNAVDPGLELRVAEVSEENQKGRHTTTTAKLLPWEFGGYVVDTPGIRQFQLWDVIPEEVAGYYRDVRPYVSRCRFPDCTHTHEADCAVKDAVADGRLDVRRYESFCDIFRGDLD
ncbi:MAG: ribosome small subunit-dependent GTPase A [Pirellulales bacterium]|nr:ribosome small subunit-dependent GTPase A [Pirellulales bacterium]